MGRVQLRLWARWALFWRRLTPPAFFLFSFILLITLGTMGLMAIPGLQAGPKLGLVDSVFTVTSAVCVTGLVVADTSTHFTMAGQAWLLLCMQLGGIGLITLTTLLIGALGKRLSLRSEMLAVAPTRTHDRPEVWQVAAGVAKFSLAIEGIGIVLLFLIWLPRFPVGDAAWHALFHGISAYCNGGFTTFGDSLMSLQDSPLSLLVISLLVILGGFGYLTFEELIRWWHSARARRQGVRIRVQGTRRLSSHTWAVLVMSGSLLALGWILFAVFEWTDTLGHLSIPDKIINAWFMSVTPRSGGLNTVDYGMIGNDSATLTMMLMFVGGSPGSMAGGIKTTTVAVLLALGLSRIRGRRFVGLKDRAIPQGTIERTVAIVLLFMSVVIVSFFVVSAVEAAGLEATQTRDQFLPIAFETVSAFSTTGLSMGVTPHLHPASKIVLIGLMFIGRVGLFSFFTAVTLRRTVATTYLRPAQEDVIVG